MSVRYVTVSTVAPDSLTSGAQVGDEAKELFVLIPGLSTNAVHQVFGSPDGTTYSRICHPAVNSATVATNPYAISTLATSCWVPIPTGFKYIKMHQTAAASSSASYQIMCKF